MPGDARRLVELLLLLPLDHCPLRLLQAPDRTSEGAVYHESREMRVSKRFKDETDRSKDKQEHRSDESGTLSFGLSAPLPTSGHQAGSNVALRSPSHPQIP